MITGKTRLYAVIGTPIEHSLSPEIYNALAERDQVDCAYLAFEILPESLSRFIDAARCLNISGFNVTMPHKEAIIPLLDGLDASASECGSVNTVVNRGGRLIGYSTDGHGLSAAISPYMPSIKGKRVLILGTGGAAKSAATALAHQGALVTAFSRRESLPELDGAHVVKWSLLPGLCPSADLIINATPLGMVNYTEFLNLDFLNLLPKGCVVFDMVYEPRETQLLRVARSVGLRAVSGVELLKSQAELAWQIYICIR